MLLCGRRQSISLVKAWLARRCSDLQWHGRKRPSAIDRRFWWREDQHTKFRCREPESTPERASSTGVQD
eukprot:SAG31_NODE_42767_length_270_cov_0.602339_1_plen_68_part_10